MNEEQFEREAKYQNACLLMENLYKKGLLTDEERHRLSQYFQAEYKPIIGHLLLAI